MRRVLFLILSVALLYAARSVLSHANANSTGSVTIFHLYAICGLVILGLFFFVNEVMPARRTTLPNRRQ